MAAGTLAAALAALGVVAPAASAGPFAPRPDGPGSGVCNDSWCGTPHRWPTAASGAGPETTPATLLDLGVASETVQPIAGGARSETAAVLGFELRVPIALRDTRPGFDHRALRLRLTGQRLGWRTGDAAARLPDGLDAGGTGADTDADADDRAIGGSVALGYSETLRWFSHRSKLAATVDVEGATGLAVRGGLGLRSHDTSARAVGAAGLALGLDRRVGGLRAHARLLRALTADPAWSSAVEVGVGVATRFDWPRFHGPWPIEVAIDLRERRGLGDGGGARERQLTTGVGYAPDRGFSRIGLFGVATEERMADGTTGRGRVLMVRFDRPFGSM